MVSPDRLSRYSQSQQELARDFVKQMHEVYSSYRLDIAGVAADASNKARTLGEKYGGALRSAAAGDDAMERAHAAAVDYQRQYAVLNEEYVKHCRDRYERYTQTLQSVRSGASVQSLDEYIDLLAEAKRELSEGRPNDTAHS
ncbi:MAG: hypothetical protein GY711_32905 [bacterium]|nr:hypothetical protein [bacterium]